MSNYLNSFITFLASFWIWIMYLGLALIWIFGKGLKKSQILHVFIVSFASWGIVRMIKDLFPLALRPFQINGYPPLTITIPQDGAFPSGHSAAAFGLAVSLFLFNKKLGIVYLLGAIFVCLGRILGNVHYPIDVIGGATLGAFVALISENIVFGKLLKQK
jgi:undecaprenyl-diphosphatase